jgi:NAD(P)-dependent dehydrogenase (short-subunit alcohol dehydrogenase family)
MPSIQATNDVEDRFSLARKIAVVVGGAGGIGRAIVEAFANAGATVVVADAKESCIDVAQSIVERGGAASSQLVDVTDEQLVEALFRETVRRFQRVDVLINSAGIASRAPAVEHTLEAWNKVMAINATGVFLCCRAAARHMMTTGGGSIVNIASIMGMSGGGLYPNISYQTSKGAVVNMTRALALEWAKQRIRVNAVAPTYVRTDFIKPLVDNPELLARIEAMTPMGRIAEPEDVVGAALFLASPASAMVTGHVLAVDGGFLAQ